MARRKNSWSYIAGEKGRNRVRAYEDQKTALILLEYRQTSLGGSAAKKRVSLGHRDRDRAKRQADGLAAELAKGVPPANQELTLRQLFDIYLREVTPAKGESKRKHDLRCAEMFLRFFGGGRKPSTLNRREWDRFVQERRSGRITPAAGTPGRPAGSRVVTYDLKWLLSVLNWAAVSGDESGGVLLERNPLKGLPFPKQETPKRPLVGQERYEEMLKVADDVDPRFGLALVLAYETGHRVGAIRKLRWSDVDLQRGMIRWRADNDKLDFEHTTPMSVGAFEALEQERRKNPALGDAWVFPSPTDPSKPCSRNLVRDWWYRAERLAELPHVERMGWHSLRRTFGTELKTTTNLKDLCALGGWKSPATLLTCYMQADEGTMREALASRRPLAAAGGS